MVDKAANPEPSDQPIVTLLQGLKDGSINPNVLTKDQRLACVETLYLEGYALIQIAQVVGRSERTVKRDLAEIASKNALTPSPELLRRLVGTFLLKAEAHQARLMRLARSTEGSVAERAQAEYLAFRVHNETLQRLQSLGYLPQRPQEVVADFVHHLSSTNEPETLTTVKAIIAEVQALGGEGGLQPEVAAGLQVLQRKVAQAELSEVARRLLAQQQAANQQEDSNVNPAPS